MNGGDRPKRYENVNWKISSQESCTQNDSPTYKFHKNILYYKVKWGTVVVKALRY